jgi:hypothetical protein
MRLEALTPFTYRWPGGEVHLQPGTPIDLPDERGQRLLNKAPEKVRLCPPTIYPGDRITWQRADLTLRYGIVDLLHTDTDGTVWAFCTLPDGKWTTLNVKHIRKIEAS